jgi:hypothetical protein
MRAATFAMGQPDAWRREGPAPVINHRRFGPVRASFRPESSVFVWECLDLAQTVRGAADLEIEAGAWGPGRVHEQQLDEIVGSLDALTNAAGRLIAAALGEISALEWQGAHLTGRAGSFRLNYWCTTTSELFVTVEFEQSQPRRVEIHD